MPFDAVPRRRMRVTRRHLDASSRLCDAPDADDALSVDGERIDDFMLRSGDTFIWHREPGAVYRESPLIREQMDAAGVAPDARLMHGALGLVLALQTTSARQPDSCIRGLDGVRFVAPVLESARIHAELSDDGAFEVHSDQLHPGLVTT